MEAMTELMQYPLLQHCWKPRVKRDLRIHPDHIVYAEHADMNIFITLRGGNEITLYYDNGEDLRKDVKLLFGDEA